MTPKKTGLDEMQRERRNHIGNQMFLLMFYALLLDSGLNGVGIRWLAYPANVMVIITVFGTVYLARTIAANSYLPPSAQRRGPLIPVVAAVSAILGFIAFKYVSPRIVPGVEGANQGGGLILLLASVVGLIVLGTSWWISRVQDRNEDQD